MTVRDFRDSRLTLTRLSLMDEAMNFEMWDLFFNILLFVLWFSLWQTASDKAFFNPYIGRVQRAGAAILGFVEPVFFGLSRRRIVLLALPFLFLFRAVLYRSVASAPQTHWRVAFGAVQGVLASTDSLATFFLLSLLSFAQFLFVLWSLSLIYVRTRPSRASAQGEAALHAFCLPFTLFRPDLRPFLLLGIGVFLSGTLFLAGGGHFIQAAGRIRIDSPASGLVMLIVSSMLAWTDCLTVLLRLVIGLIIGSWVSMFAGSQELHSFCRDWLDFFLGPIRRYLLRIGMFDLSPILFFLAVQFVYAVLRSVLLGTLISLS